jgi:hypothetical protein
MMLGADSSDAPKNGETVAKVWSFALFFSLLCSYYVLRFLHGCSLSQAKSAPLHGH